MQDYERYGSLHDTCNLAAKALVDQPLSALYGCSSCLGRCSKRAQDGWAAPSPYKKPSHSDGLLIFMLKQFSLKKPLAN